MPPAFGYSRDERIYLLNETTYGVTPNASGVSSLAGSNCCSHISVELDPVRDLYESEYKTGSRSMPIGQPGRKIGTWRASFPLKGSGAAGTPADYGPLLLSAFGQKTLNAGVSVVYALIDNPGLTFSMFRFRQPAGLYQQLGISCAPTRITWNLGQNMANWQAEGECFWVLDSEQFSTADTAAKGGLTAFPTEPVSPVTNGTQAQGFLGALTVDSNVLVNIQQLTVVAEFGWTPTRDTFGTYYSTGLLGGLRNLTASMRAYDDASAAMIDLRAKSLTKGLINVTAQIGSTPGNIHTIQLNNGQFDFPKTTDAGLRFGNTWSAMVFHESTPGAKDEITLTET